MNTDATHNVSDSDPAPQGKGIGECLRQARQMQGLSLQAVATRLRTPLRIVEAMEQEDWSRLGAPIYVRGHLSSYTRLLGLPSVATDAVIAPTVAEPPTLISMTRSSRFAHNVDQLARRAVYIVLTVSIVGSVVWLATSGHLPENQATLASLDLAPAPSQSASPTIVQTAPAPAVVPDESPLIASLTPFHAVPRALTAAESEQAATAPAETERAQTQELVLSVREQSWIEVFGSDGHKLESGLLQAGSERRYATDQVARVTLGNADAVEVRVDGDALDLAPFQRANVARFALSSDGRVVPTDG